MFTTSACSIALGTGLGWLVQDPATDPAASEAVATEPAPPAITASASADASGAAAPEAEPRPRRSEPAPLPPASGEMGGRWGVGAIRTLAGLNGINVRYFLSDRLALGLNLGVATFTYREPEAGDACPGDDCDLDEVRTVAAVGSSFEALYFLHQGRPAGNLPFRADFALGGRFGVMGVVNATDAPDNLDDTVEIDIEIPLLVHLMFGEHFALAPEFGVDFRIVPASRRNDSNPGDRPASSISGDAVDGPGFGFDISPSNGNSPGIGLFAGAGLHYYF